MQTILHVMEEWERKLVYHKYNARKRSESFESNMNKRLESCHVQSMD